MRERLPALSRSRVTSTESVTEEKRAACESKRPKSREETPKEGSDNAKALPHRNNMQPRCTKCKSFGSPFPVKFRIIAGLQHRRVPGFPSYISVSYRHGEVRCALTSK